eukprot:6164167-Pyramimonas_sp.AAC.1
MDGDHDPFQDVEDNTDGQQFLDGMGSYTNKHRGAGTKVENYVPRQVPAPKEDNDRREGPPYQ